MLLAALVNATSQTNQMGKALVLWKELLLIVAPLREMGSAVHTCPHPTNAWTHLALKGPQDRDLDLPSGGI